MIRSDRILPTGANGKRATSAARMGRSDVWLAWMAHVYTALGLILAAAMAVFIVEGSRESLRWAFACMLVACLVDSTDGTLARRLRVKELLPNFDGGKLDDLIDFLTFTALPLALVWRADLLPAPAQWLLVVALLASAYGFCQIPAKTTDGYFVGFPSYWNIVAFYLYALEIPAWFAAVVILLLSALTFVPSYYLYPSRGSTLSRLTSFLGGVWVVLLTWILWKLPEMDLIPGAAEASQVRTLAFVSLFYPIYYMVVSWGITLHRWRRPRGSV
jgi:phosphatidylcholine synthase